MQLFNTFNSSVVLKFKSSISSSFMHEATTGIVSERIDLIKEEDPRTVNEKLEEFDKRLQSYLDSDNYINSTWNSALKEAMAQDPAYVRDESFRLSFLRADEWNPAQAADRMYRFFQAKKGLFGVEKLTKDITIDDLDDDGDLRYLASGVLQMTPLKDRSGRRVSVLVPMLKPEAHSDRNCVSAKRVARVSMLLLP